MANNNISEYLQIFDKRIFFDVSSNGCGSNCIYCFTKNPGMPQELLSTEVIHELCTQIKKLRECSESIISLCPNTEPLKSNDSRLLVFQIIQELSPYVKFIQISTKEYIPIDFLERLDYLADKPRKIRISVSLPYLNFTDRIEPGAAPIRERLQNFENIKRFPGISSILYLRPFNQQMISDRELYIDVIRKCQPDDICLGAEFVPKVNDDQLCTFMYNNNLAVDIFKCANIDDIFSFAEYLRQKVKRKVFFSSVCNIANCSDYGCILKLYNYDKRYCLDCCIDHPC
ncbi:hypothetical protein [Bacteroides acidifaciens]|jgi:DNA repair photolyase|uniref:hypothetical protein n=1 Tax=Bacteroides acidifaciens TaxID=85831 RepID=UPI002558023F|nr:hypothetical protein [Bacteroides acidifaciens]